MIHYLGMNQFTISLSPILHALFELREERSVDYLLIIRQEKSFQFQKDGFTQRELSQVMNALNYDENCALIIRPTLKEIKTLTMHDDANLDDQYWDLFTSMTQNTCKYIAKEWIKIIEPNKQTRFPYRSFNANKPLWWPANINHIEPDHLDKNGRVNLLISILRNLSFDWKRLYEVLKNLKYKNENSKLIIDELFYIALIDRAKRAINDPLHSAEYFELLDESIFTMLQSDSVEFPVSSMRYTMNKGREIGGLMVSQIAENMINDQIFRLKAVDHGPEISHTGFKRRRVSDDKHDMFPKRYTLPIRQLLEKEVKTDSSSLILTSETAGSNEEWTLQNVHLDTGSLYELIDEELDQMS